MTNIARKALVEAEGGKDEILTLKQRRPPLSRRPPPANSIKIEA
jgi:hypothetical protein